MTEKEAADLARLIKPVLDESSRANTAKPEPYWYPLSLATYGVEEILEVLDSLCAFRTTMWEKTSAFEQRFAEYQGCREGVMVSSGSSADLLVAFMLSDPQHSLLKRGDEVLVPIVTWPTHAWSIMMAGLRARFVDVDPRTLNVDFDDMERRITPATRAMSLVHLMGNPCDMDRALGLAAKHDLVVVEDCCEALGSEWNGKKVGNFGFAGGFSFFFSHHMTTLEGGMITCQTPETADLARILRAHGWLRNSNAARSAADDPGVDPRYTFVNWGFNVRPTELQAGFGLRQLEKLPAFNQRRQVLAERFFAYIDRTPYLQRPQVCEAAKPAWFALPLVVSGDAPFARRDIVNFLEDSGVETRPIVAGNMARQPVARHFADFDVRDYVGADIIHRNGFYVGLSPLHGIEQVDRLVECLSSYLARY